MRTYENEPIVVQRDVKAVAIPAGAEVNLKLGQVGYITQALGGSFTVYIDGNLFRIAGQDADAIGKSASKAPEIPPGASEDDVKNVSERLVRALIVCGDEEALASRIAELHAVAGPNFLPVLRHLPHDDELHLGEWRRWADALQIAV